MHSATARPSLPDPHLSDPQPMAQYPVELRDETGSRVMWTGIATPLAGEAIPSVIKHNGDVFARTSGVTGGGSAPTRTVFMRSAPAFFVRDQEG